MSSRSTRRRQHKKLARLARLSPEERRAEAARLLAVWKAEARSRARSLTAPTAWSLAGQEVEAKALALDPSGELLKELHCLIAEAVAAAAGEPASRVGKSSRRGPAVPESGDGRSSPPPRNILLELLKDAEADG